MQDDYRAALECLPHGQSFRFIDEISSLIAGLEGSGIYRVRGDEAFLEGHFPGEPMVPGVILVEAIAQLGGVVAQSSVELPPLENLRLSGIRVAKIFGAAVPGDCLELRAKVEGRLGGLIQIDGQVIGPAGQLATAKVTLSGTVSEV